MNWLSQVAHMMRKDLREQRLSVLTYLAVVAVLVWAAVRVGQLEHDVPIGIGVLANLIIIAVSMVATASVMHADSPTRPTSLWMSRPLWPSAVLAAKVGFFLAAIVLPALAAQAALLAWYDVPASELASGLLRSLATFGFFHVVALLLASVTRDTRSTILALFGLLIGGIVIAWATSESEVPDVVRSVLFAAGLLGALIIPALFYQTRDPRRWLRSLAQCSLACLLFGVQVGARPSAVRALPETVRTPSVALDTLLAVQSSGQESELVVPLTFAEIPASWRVSVAAGTALITLADGTTLDAPVRVSSSSMTGTAVPDLPGIHWLVKRSSDGIHRSSLAVQLSQAQWRLLLKGINRIEIEGRANVHRAIVRSQSPFVEGTEIRAPGVRARIERISIARGRAEARVVSANVLGGREQFLNLFDAHFGLLSADQREAAPLFGRSGHGGSLPLAGLGSSMDYWTADYSTTPTPWDTLYAREPAWYSGASLITFGWTEVGSFPIRASAQFRGHVVTPRFPRS